MTMTSGLAGDDSSLGGDDQLWDRMARSRDWVRHILGRRLETTPGESFAYSGANSHLLSAIVADAAGCLRATYWGEGSERTRPTGSDGTRPAGRSRQRRTGGRSRPGFLYRLQPDRPAVQN